MKPKRKHATKLRIKSSSKKVKAKPIRVKANTIRNNHEAMLNDLISSTNGIVWEADAKTLRFSFVSDFAVKALGYPLEQWYENDFWIHHLHPDDRNQASTFCRSSIEALQDHTFEYRMVAANGSSIWFRDSVHVLSVNGKPAKLRGIMLDITDAKRVEQKLIDTQALNQLLIKNSPEAIIFAKTNGDIISANAAACALFDRTEAEIISAGRAELVDKNDARLGKLLEERDSKGFVHGELTGIKGDGSKFEMELTSTIIMLPDGTLATSIIAKDITKRKEAEKKLQESELKFRALFQSTTDSVILINKNFQVVDFNQVAEHYTRAIYRVALVEGMNMLELNNEANRQGFIENINKAFEGITTTKDLEITFPNQTTSWWRVQYFPVKDAEGNVFAVAFNSSNIDAEMKAIQRLTGLTNSIPDSVIFEYWVSADGAYHAFRYMSGGALKVFEMSPEEIVSDVNKGFSLVHPDDVQKLLSTADQARRELSQYDLEYRIMVKSGKTKWVRAKSTPKKLLDGSVLFEGILMDITHEKIREIENTKLSLIARETKNLVIITDKHRKIEWVNQAFIETTGYSLEETIGRTPTELLQGANTDQEVLKVVREKLNQQQQVRFEILNYKKNKEEYWLDIDIQPIFNQEGSLVSYVAIQTNITDKKRNELLLRQQSEEIIRKNQLLLSVSENLPDSAIYQLLIKPDGERKFTFLSAGVEKLTSYRPVEILEDSSLVYDQIHPDDRPGLEQAERTAVETMSQYDQEFRVITPAGNLWYRARSVPRKTNEGVLFEGYVSDITNHRKLLENLYFTRFTIDHFADAVFWILPDASFFDFNEAAYKSLGYTKDEFRSLRVPDIDETYDDLLWPKHWNDLKSKRSLNFITQQKRKDGSLIDVEITANLIEYNGQEYNCAFVRDITERLKSDKVIKQSEHRFKRITENLPNAVIYEFKINPDGAIAIPFIGENIINLVGLTASEIVANPFALMGLIVKEDVDKFNEAVAASARQLTDFDCCCKFEFGNDQYKWLRAVSKPEQLADGSILWDGIITDETHSELNQLHEKNKANLLEELLRGATIEAILHSIASTIEGIQTGYKCSILLMDEEGRHLLHGAAPSLPDFYNKAIHGIAIGAGEGSCGTAAATGELVIVEDIQTHPYWKNYKQLAEEAHLRACWSYPIKDVNKKVLGTFAIYHTIIKSPTPLDIEMISQYGELIALAIDRSKIIQDLHEREVKLERIAQNLPKGSVYQFKIGHDGTISMPYFSDGLARQLGISGKDVMKDVLAFNARCHPDDVPSVQQAVFESAEKLSDLQLRVGRFLDNDGHYHHLGWYAKPNRLSDGSTVWEGIVMDETDQHDYQQKLEEREQRLEKTLNEKEILIKEIHHRIKNNLQLISSMLYLKVLELTDESTKNFINETRQKIHSIAVIHEKLLQTESVNELDIHDYLTKLISDVQKSAVPASMQIIIDITIDRIIMHIDKAIYCGLIVNELITNAIKHGFKNHKHGRIVVRFSTLHQLNHLVIQNDGEPFPEEVEFEKAQSFGLKMLSIFANQLHATMTLTRQPETKIEISFPN